MNAETLKVIEEIHQHIARRRNAALQEALKQDTKTLIGYGASARYNGQEEALYSTLLFLDNLTDRLNAAPAVLA